jgi:oxygen-independent coproporphyrinogen-3 oxidase
MSRPFSLYVHVPFCRKRCDFCSFYLEIYREQAATGFLSALLTEIQIYAKEDQTGGRPLQSIYFGGGTPTVLGAHRLLEVLDGIRMHFPLAGGCEVTIEAHPATVSKEVLCRLAEGGVTRMSFGAESMEDDELVRIGRPGLTSETVAAVLHARAAGFSDINLDLMYGLPGQSVESWRHTLDRCLELSPTHFSCYALTVEEGTQLARAIESRRSQAPDETLQVMMDESAQEVNI